jgi:hypothetical protein
MKQGIQSVIKDAEVNEYGCLALCYIRWAEVETGKDLTPAEALAVIQKARAAGIIGAECFVKQPEALMRLVWPGARGVIEKSDTPRGARYVVCNKRPMHTHFTFCDNGVIFDPLPPDRPAARQYKPANYRVLRGAK